MMMENIEEREKKTGNYGVMMIESERLESNHYIIIIMMPI